MTVGGNVGGTGRKARLHCGCAADSWCFYCGENLRSDHEHDHFPIPRRHEGKDTVPACYDCHHLKDRTAIARWPMSVCWAALGGLGDLAASFVTLYVTAIGEPGDMTIGDADPSLILSAVDDCSTPEARIYVARTAAFAMDVQKARTTPA